MKQKSKQCPNACGAMHRCHIKTTSAGKTKWVSLPWQYCPECKMMLVD